MALSEAEHAVLLEAGTAPDPNVRHRAVAIVLNKVGADRRVARDRLAEGFVAATQPSFHLVPRGKAMVEEPAFTIAYDRLAAATNEFRVVREDVLVQVLLEHPSVLAPLRMILGMTHNELAVAMRLVDPHQTPTGNALKAFERRPPSGVNDRRIALATLAARTTLALMNREVLGVPEAASECFHSKLDKRDTLHGWTSVAANAGGVPYSALLYQRYIGGAWRQVQDAYSEVKGDSLLEIPIESLLVEHGIPYHRTKPGASGAAHTAERFGLSPGPDFVLPPRNPTVVIESKVAEDGGTARDKAARIRAMVEAANDRGLLACAVVDGKGWSERPNAMLEVVIATSGRTYTLSTLEQLLLLPAVASLRQ